MPSLALSTLFTAFIAISSSHALDLRTAAVTKASPTACSSVIAGCTASVQLQSASYYCASLLGSSISFVARTRTVTVAPTCGATTVASALQRRAAAVSASPPSCFSASDSAAASSSCSCFSLPHTATVTTLTRTKYTWPFSISASGLAGDGGDYYAVAQGSKGHQYIANLNNGAADEFLLGPNGELVDLNAKMQVANEAADPTGYEPVALAEPTAIAAGGFQPLVCSLVKSNCHLNCKVNGDAQNYACYDYPEQWYISPGPINEAACSKYQPMVVA